MISYCLWLKLIKKNTLQLKGFGTELSGRVQNLYAMVCVQGHGPVARIPTMAVLR